MIGFIGIGEMGAPIAAHLLGWEGGLTVCDLNPAAVADLVARGASAAADPSAVAEVADLIEVMVVDDAQVRSVVAQVLDAASPGTVVAIHSTIHPSTAIELAAAAAPRGIAVVDAPVSGGAMGAHAGRLAVMIGGTEDAFEKCRSPFSCFADLVIHVGPVGAATRCKVARNLVQIVAFAAAVEGQRLAAAAGIDLRQLAAVTRHSDAVTGGPSAIMLRDPTRPLAPDDPLRPIFTHARDIQLKDLALAVDLADELGVEVPFSRLTRERLADSLGVPLV